MFGFLNLGSLVLGIIAWLLPIGNLLRSNKQVHKNEVVICMLSFSACATSISFQLFYNDQLVKIEDWTALMDTSGSAVDAVTILLIGTILLNTLTIIVHRIKKKRTILSSENVNGVKNVQK
ncbi:hypothetical protein [Lysinibacillus sp. fls2-241-R2A-57]|uniref:hypothetical protein n=1 Tax=Lysinibacillus sp. fls2-241-R2A-57 TaxID=3040292 RepID=UPI0025562F99|nr:hypothetical protein [Lysinibacillus sp. fls2-241-R2A-57]